MLGLDTNLDTSISENGDNLSAGQRQLLCVCRALLVSRRIICVDEATASVDQETDAVIQNVLICVEIKVLRRVRAEPSRRPPRHRRDACSIHRREMISTQVLRTAPQFKRATLIVIAHRIKTIVDSDQILVLDRGRLVEDGAPAELMARNGAFAEMVRASRSRSATNLVAAANS